MDIRLAAAADIPRLIALLQQVGQVHHQIRPELFRLGAQKYDRQALLELLQDESCPIFVAVQDGFVAGYCFCQLRSYDGKSACTRRSELYIDDLCVDENCRNQGVAQSLYRHVCRWAKARGVAFVTLNVWCGNDGAMAFYKKMGLRSRSITMEMPLEEEIC